MSAILRAIQPAVRCAFVLLILSSPLWAVVVLGGDVQ